MHSNSVSISGAAPVPPGNVVIDSDEPCKLNRLRFLFTNMFIYILYSFFCVCFFYINVNVVDLSSLEHVYNVTQLSISLAHKWVTAVLKELYHAGY